MSRPESFVWANGQKLYEWFCAFRGTAIEALAALRDAVVAEKDAEFAAERADAIRAGIRADDATARAERAERDIREWERRHNALDCKVDALRTRAERAEAALADAQRAGAEQALAVAKDAALMVANAFLTVNSTYPKNWYGTENYAKDAVAKHYAPPAPEPPSVRLGEWVVTREKGTRGSLCFVARGKLHYSCDATIPSLLNSLDYTPTPTEYAALVALAEAPDAE